MLTAGSVAQLCDAQDGWVDPVNNLVCADVAGEIAYQCRGEVPVRSSEGGRRLPVVGWVGECEWMSAVPFDQLPRTVDPSAGYVMTANNAIVDGDAPYLSYTFAQPFRAERLRSLLDGPAGPTADSLAAMQADTVSVAARGWGRVLGSLGPFDDRTPRRRGRCWPGSTGTSRPSRPRRCCTPASSGRWRPGCTGRFSAPIPGTGSRRAGSRRRFP